MNEVPALPDWEYPTTLSPRLSARLPVSLNPTTTLLLHHAVEVSLVVKPEYRVPAVTRSGGPDTALKRETGTGAEGAVGEANPLKSIGAPRDFRRSRRSLTPIAFCHPEDR